MESRETSSSRLEILSRSHHAQEQLHQHVRVRISLPVPIICELGYTAAQVQLLTVPVYFVGACSTLLVARLSYIHRRRWVSIILPFCTALFGYIVLLTTPHPALPGLTCFVLFFIADGLYTSIIGTMSWVGNNLAPLFNRTVGIPVLMTV